MKDQTQFNSKVDSLAQKMADLQKRIESLQSTRKELQEKVVAAAAQYQDSEKTTSLYQDSEKMAGLLDEACGLISSIE
jgi:predicted  nucleic acid-binding Zn-ribbon protein